MTWGTFITYLVILTILYYAIIIVLDMSKSKTKVVKDDIYEFDFFGDNSNLLHEEVIIEEDLINEQKNVTEIPEINPDNRISEPWEEVDITDDEFSANQVETDLIGFDMGNVYREGISVDSLDTLDPDTL